MERGAGLLERGLIREEGLLKRFNLQSGAYWRGGGGLLERGFLKGSISSRGLIREEGLLKRFDLQSGAYWRRGGGLLELLRYFFSIIQTSCKAIPYDLEQSCARDKISSTTSEVFTREQ